MKPQKLLTYEEADKLLAQSDGRLEPNEIAQLRIFIYMQENEIHKLVEDQAGASI